MIRSKLVFSFNHRLVVRIGQAVVALAVLLIGVFSAAIVCAADEADVPVQRFHQSAPWLPKDSLPVGEVVAFEEHEHFVYLASRLSAPPGASTTEDGNESRMRLVLLRPATLIVDIWPFEGEPPAMGQPSGMSMNQVLSESRETTRRAVYVYHSPEKEIARERASISADSNVCNVTVTTNDQEFQLALPLRPSHIGRISVESTDGEVILPRRRLPAGVMPYGPEGMRLIERWDTRYREDSSPPWDKGFPSSHLKAAVEDGTVKPGRAVVLGCGTGTNAIYLGKKGFDVTAIDVAPTALNLAEEKAAKAGVKVRWLLADVLAPPNLKPFDFIFDRGCYHGVRRANAEGYVHSVKRLSQKDTQILILAGNANEEQHYGPPRVKEEELRDDFSSWFDFVSLKTIRFDSADPNEQGALAWSVLLRRRIDDKRYSYGTRYHPPNYEAQGEGEKNGEFGQSLKFNCVSSSRQQLQ